MIIAMVFISLVAPIPKISIYRIIDLSSSQPARANTKMIEDDTGDAATKGLEQTPTDQLNTFIWISRFVCFRFIKVHDFMVI